MKQKDILQIALVQGGYTNEYHISVKSSKNIYRSLIKRNDWNITIVDIKPDAWLAQVNQTWYPIDKNDFSVLLEDGQRLTFDAIFNVVHGTPGEDGKLQAYFDLINIPYNTCNALSSAVSFNKKFTVDIAAQNGISTARSLIVNRTTPWSVAKILEAVDLPLFVKPNAGGSSLATTKVTAAKDLEEAIHVGFEFGHQVLIEEFIPGREFSVGVYGWGHDKPQVLPVTEIVSNTEWFDYDAKYQGQSNEITPAQIDAVIYETLQRTAIQTFLALQCRYLTRVDLIWHDEKQVPYLLEINTTPGQTAESIIPQQIEVAGIDEAAFYQEMMLHVLKQKKATT